MKEFIENMGEIEFKPLLSQRWEYDNNLIKIQDIDGKDLKELEKNKYIEDLLNIKEGLSFELFKCNPKALFNPYRFDLFVKYNYIKAYVENRNIEEATKIYLDHIRAFNNFKEPDKTKNSKEDFLKAINGLIEFTKNNKDLEYFVPVSKTGNIIDGSHRVAASMYFNRSIKVSLFDILDADYSYKFFEERNMNKEYIRKIADSITGIDDSLEDLTIKEDEIQKIELNQDIYYKEKINNSYRLIISKYEVK